MSKATTLRIWRYLFVIDPFKPYKRQRARPFNALYALLLSGAAVCSFETPQDSNWHLIWGIAGVVLGAMFAALWLWQTMPAHPHIKEKEG